MESSKARLLALYLAATTLCAMMISWVIFAPGSCTSSFIAAISARSTIEEPRRVMAPRRTPGSCGAAACRLAACGTAGVQQAKPAAMTIGAR